MNTHDIPITAPCGGYGCSQIINELTERVAELEFALRQEGERLADRCSDAIERASMDAKS